MVNHSDPYYFFWHIFNDEVKALLGDQTPVVAQHMIQAALFGLLEKQANEMQAEIVDEKPKYLS